MEGPSVFWTRGDVVLLGWRVAAGLISDLFAPSVNLVDSLFWPPSFGKNVWEVLGLTVRTGRGHRFGGQTGFNVPFADLSCGHTDFCRLHKTSLLRCENDRHSSFPSCFFFMSLYKTWAGGLRVHGFVTQLKYFHDRRRLQTRASEGLSDGDTFGSALAVEGSILET